MARNQPAEGQQTAGHQDDAGGAGHTSRRGPDNAFRALNRTIKALPMIIG